MVAQANKTKIGQMKKKNHDKNDLRLSCDDYLLDNTEDYHIFFLLS